MSDTAAPRSHAIIAWSFGGVLAIAILVGSSGGEIGRTAYGDGLIYRYVAGNLTTDPADVHQVVVERGTSLRYGRIGLPAVIWVLGLGQRDLLPWGQAIAVVLSAAAISGAAAAMFPRGGLIGAVVPFLAPGVALSIAGGYAEVVALALALWAVVWALRDRWWIATALLSAAMLTRENAGAMALGLFLWVLIRRRYREALILTLSLAPLAGWYLFVAWRYGHVPVLDPYLRTATDTVGLPIIAPFNSVFDSVSAGAVAAAAFHLALGVIAVLLARRSTLGFLAAIASAQLLITGPFAWRFVGDASRTGVFIQVLTLMAMVVWLRPAWRERENDMTRSSNTTPVPA